MRCNIESLKLPDCDNVLLSFEAGVLQIVLNRPEKRNALNAALVDELINVFETIEPDRTVRAVVLRGAGGHFCAGGDLGDMGNKTSTRETHKTGIRNLNRRFGELSVVINGAPQVVVALLEGAVLGGGFGMACVSDVTIADEHAKIGIPETTLGIAPAQIAPFVVRRIGLTQARRLALLGERIDGEEAQKLGIAHYVTRSAEDMETRLQEVLQKIKRCAPGANAITKKLLQNAARDESAIEDVLDRAADIFIETLHNAEGQEGAHAFLEKRPPSWLAE